MKLHSTDINIHSSGSKSKSAYQIAQTAKVMDMFSNMLYSDKIKAVIRELSTNAWDSHVMAGNTDQAPYMKLPSHNDMEFRLRDYGTGLSPEQLENMYLTYGASNKNDSNDFNGCMGIGSKSPFAYTDSFTTTSYYNGMKYVYINAKDEDGLPTLHKFHEQPTDQPNGLEISFAVKEGDATPFMIKAQSVLRWFPVEFECDNNIYDASPFEYSLEGNGWKMGRHDHDTGYSSDRKAKAIMGYVEYPIDANQIFTEEERKDWYKHYSAKNPANSNLFWRELLREVGLELHFEIGEVEMDISREGLQYTKSTITSIRNKLNIIKDELLEQVEKRLELCDTKWEACVTLKRLNSQGFIISALQTLGVKWRGETLSGYDGGFNVPDHIKVTQYSYGAYDKDKLQRHDSHKKRSWESLKIIPKENVRFYEHDMKTGNHAAVKRVFNDKTESVVDVIYLVTFDNESDKAEFCEHVGIKGEDIYSCSEVPRHKKKSGPRAAKNRMPAGSTFAYNPSRYAYKRDEYWNLADNLDFDAGGVYVEINRWEVCGEEDLPALEFGDINIHGKKYWASEPKKIRDLNERLVNLGISTPRIIGVKSAAIKKFKDADQWMSYGEWVLDRVNAFMKSSSFAKDVSDYITWYNSDRETNIYNQIARATINIEDSDSPLKKLVDFSRIADKIGEDIINQVDVINNVIYFLYGHTNDLKKINLNDDKIGGLMEESDKRYADLLNVVIPRYVSFTEEKANSFVQLVNLIDGVKK